MIAPGLVIAAPRSSSGKTTITLGLLRAFHRRGVAVRGLKCGPDYIDPAFHAAACGKPSLNLDAWAMSPDLMASLASDAAQEAELTLCEGLMGLFDGVPAEEGRSGSSADVAAATGWPVVLVIDVSGQSQSAGAVALGCTRFDPRITIAGVILNKVGSERHRYLISLAMEKAGLKILGSVPRDASAMIPERHLGLVQAEETKELDRILDHMADLVEAHIDLEAVRAAARIPTLQNPAHLHAIKPPGQRIALARALAVEPKVLLLDEPFGALDAKVRKELRRWLRRLHDELHITSIFVTHDQEEALEVADRVVLMNGGRIEQVGSPEEVWAHPASAFVYGFLGNVNRFEGRVDRGLVRIGDYTWSSPAHQGVNDRKAVAFVRPHEFEIERYSPGAEGIAVQLGRALPFGGSVRLELQRTHRDDEEFVEAELPVERFAQLALRTGETLVVRPRVAQVFVE